MSPLIAIALFVLITVVVYACCTCSPCRKCHQWHRKEDIRAGYCPRCYFDITHEVFFRR